MLSCHHRPRGRVATVGLAVLLAILGPVLGSAPARAAAGRDRLLPGEVLLAGQSISAGRDTLTMQADGNLVLYAPGSIPLWASNTAGHGGARLVMQADGNLVVAAPGGRPLWASNTTGHGGAQLVLQTDGDAILDAPGNVTLWSTNTSKQTYAVIQLPAHGWGPPTGSRRRTRAARWPPKAPTGSPTRRPRSAGARTTSRAGTAPSARPGPTGRPAGTTGRC